MPISYSDTRLLSGQGSTLGDSDRSSSPGLVLFDGESKSKNHLISEAVKARLGMDRVSLIHQSLPELPLLTASQSMSFTNEHRKQAA
ncbi:unnamed protein product [Lota lota]